MHSRNSLLFPLSILPVLLYTTLVAAQSAIEVDLSALVRRGPIHQPEIFRHAVSVINNLEHGPSCHRLAAKHLLESCQALESPPEEDETAEIDNLKSVFAARLAVCEISTAQAIVPPQCMGMIPVKNDGRFSLKCRLPGKRCSERSNVDFQPSSRKQMNACLHALESRPQWWTSYSNARQNAFVMCHTAMAEVEREKILQLHKSLIESSADVSQVMSKTAHNTNELLVAQQQFAKAVSAMQVTAAKEFMTQKSKFTSLFDGMADQFRLMGNRFAEGTTAMTKSLVMVDSNIQKANNGLDALQQSLKVHTGNAQDQALALQAILLHSAEAMESRLNNLSNSISTLQDRTEQYSHKQSKIYDNITEHMAAMENLVNRMESRAAIFVQPIDYICRLARWVKLYFGLPLIGLLTTGTAIQCLIVRYWIAPYLLSLIAHQVRSFHD